MVYNTYNHISVLLQESVNGLNIKPDGIYIDGTFGLGGHSKLILSYLGKQGLLIAIDRDPEAVMLARKTIKDSRFIIKCSTFSYLYKIIEQEKLIGHINGILLDLGISSLQLNNPNRGFSFMYDGPLDMRMNQNIGESAATWLMTANELDISKILTIYGEERFAKKIAKAIFKYNHTSSQKILTTTKELVTLIHKVIPFKEKNKHSATRSFQAIRIYINNELNEIQQVLDGALNVLAPYGRLSIITFNSLEDRIVKHFFKKHSQHIIHTSVKLPLTDMQLKLFQYPKLKILGKQKPSIKEIMNNSRARSSIVRFAEKIKY